MKQCSKCGEQKEFIDFYKDKNAKDGRRCSCKSCEIARRTEFRNKNREKHNEYRRSIYTTETSRKSRQKILEKDPEYFNKARKKYFDKNRKEILKKNNMKDKERRVNDILYKLRRATSNRITCSIKRMGFRKKSKTAEMLDCTWEDFKKHLESQFTEGMNWDNYGEWHIDHIVPCCSSSTIEELQKLNHFSNLQPLWAKDNMSKGGKY